MKTLKHMTFVEFMDRMLKAFPDAEVAEDINGMLVISTNLMLATQQGSDDDDIIEWVIPFVDGGDA